MVRRGHTEQHQRLPLVSTFTVFPTGIQQSILHARGYPSVSGEVFPRSSVATSGVLDIDIDCLLVARTVQKRRRGMEARKGTTVVLDLNRIQS